MSQPNILLRHGWHVTVTGMAGCTAQVSWNSQKTVFHPPSFHLAWSHQKERWVPSGLWVTIHFLVTETWWGGINLLTTQYHLQVLSGAPSRKACGLAPPHTDVRIKGDRNEDFLQPVLERVLFSSLKPQYPQTKNHQQHEKKIHLSSICLFIS